MENLVSVASWFLRCRIVVSRLWLSVWFPCRVRPVLYCIIDCTCTHYIALFDLFSLANQKVSKSTPAPKRTNNFSLFPCSFFFLFLLSPSKLKPQTSNQKKKKKITPAPSPDRNTPKNPCQRTQVPSCPTELKQPVCTWLSNAFINQLVYPPLHIHIHHRVVGS